MVQGGGSFSVPLNVTLADAPLQRPIEHKASNARCDQKVIDRSSLLVLDHKGGGGIKCPSRQRAAHAFDRYCLHDGEVGMGKSHGRIQRPVSTVDEQLYPKVRLAGQEHI